MSKKPSNAATAANLATNTADVKLSKVEKYIVKIDGNVKLNDAQRLGKVASKIKLTESSGDDFEARIAKRIATYEARIREAMSGNDADAEMLKTYFNDLLARLAIR